MIARRLARRAMLALVLVVGAAHAQDAVEWKHRGDEAMDAGRAAEALAAYRRAASIEPSPALDYNIGRALLAIGDFAGALDAFERYDTTAPEELKRKTHRLAEVMAELRAKVATLTISIDDAPESTHVTIRGVDAGALPITALRLNAGRAELRVERPGFEPFVEDLELAPGQVHKVHVVLRPERPVAHITLVATPAGAQVTVDGEARGVTPIDLELTPGSHRLALVAPKHERRDLTLSLARGESRRIEIQLSRESPPMTSRWWFWTGAGVLVAGAAIAIVAASTEQSPSQGSLGTFRVP